MAGLPGRLREHSNPLLKYVLEVKKMARLPGEAPGAPQSFTKVRTGNKKLQGFPGRLREHSNPFLKYLLEVTKWPVSR